MFFQEWVTYNFQLLQAIKFTQAEYFSKIDFTQMATVVIF